MGNRRIKAMTATEIKVGEKGRERVNSIPNCIIPSITSIVEKVGKRKREIF